MTKETQNCRISPIEVQGYMINRRISPAGLTMQEVNHAIAEFKSYPLVCTMDDVSKKWESSPIRASGSGMRCLNARC